MAHGVLFIGFMIMLFLAAEEGKMKNKDTMIFFIASLVPFGTFWTKSKIKAYE